MMHLPLVIFSCRTQQRDAADVDFLDSLRDRRRRYCRDALFKGVEVAHHDGDWSDRLCGEVCEVRLLGGPCEDATVDGGVEGLYPSTEHLWRASDGGHIAVDVLASERDS